MCGRYAASRRPEDLVTEFEVDPRAVPAVPLAPDWNVAPTKDVHAVLERPLHRTSDDDAAAEPDDRTPVRQLRVLRWGLVPSWAKDPSRGSRLVNARVETVAEKPSFRSAFARRRCLLPADGYYEWQGPAARRRPVFVTPRDGSVLAMAGLYEVWRDRTRDREDPAAWLWTAVVLTTTAEDSLGQVHDRMPLLVEPDRRAAWLDPSAADDPDALRSLLVPAAPGLLEAVPVGPEVNDVRHNGPQLVEPLPTTQPSDEPAPEQPGLF